MIKKLLTERVMRTLILSFFICKFKRKLELKLLSTFDSTQLIFYDSFDLNLFQRGFHTIDTIHFSATHTYCFPFALKNPFSIFFFSVIRSIFFCNFFLMKKMLIEQLYLFVLWKPVPIWSAYSTMTLRAKTKYVYLATTNCFSSKNMRPFFNFQHCRQKKNNNIDLLRKCGSEKRIHCTLFWRESTLRHY